MSRLPRTGRSSKNKRGGRGSTNNNDTDSASSASASAPDLPTLFSSVEQFLSINDLHSAERLLRSPSLLGSLRPESISAQNPAHVQRAPAMELMAQLMLDKGRLKEAHKWLSSCCACNPSEGGEKWMTFGQLMGGREALHAFKQGLSCMLKVKADTERKFQAQKAAASSGAFTMDRPVSEEEMKRTLDGMNKQISSAYASMAELYVTDLCDEPEAESECEKLLRLALLSSDTNPDALYGLANLRLIQGRTEEASTTISQCLGVLEELRAKSIEQMSALKVAAAAERSSTNADDAADDDDSMPLSDVSYELRVACAKLALELEHYAPTLKLLEQLLEEDDRVIEVAHLAAVAAFHAGEYASSLAFIEHAQQLLAAGEAEDQDQDAGMSMGMGDEDDEEDDEQDPDSLMDQQAQIVATKNALQQLQQQVAEALKNAPPTPTQEDDDGGDEDEDEDEGSGAAPMEDDHDHPMQD